MLDRQLLNFFDIKYSIKVIANPQKLLTFHRDFFSICFAFFHSFQAVNGKPHFSQIMKDPYRS